jgi:hypothetical protein
MTQQDKEQLRLEINHIFESGANELRIYEMVINFIDNKNGVNKNFVLTDVICCGVLERMQIGWMKLEDGTRCMPYIKGHSDENMYRVNNCPSCGKYVRDVMVEP